MLDGVAPILCADMEEAQRLRPQVSRLHERYAACQGMDTARRESALLELRQALNVPQNPVEQVYLTQVRQELAQLDLELRTALGRTYPTREAARNAQKTYDGIRSDFQTQNPRKHADAFRERIARGDFSEETRAELEAELFQFENAKELKTAKHFSTFSTVVLLAITVASFFFSIAATPTFFFKDVTVLGNSLLVGGRVAAENLTFMDGLFNGLIVFGRSIGEMFTNGFHEYVAGFDHGWIGNALWLVLGFFWQVCKQMLLFFPKYLVSLALTCFQHGSLGYYVGYVIGSAIPLSVAQLNFGEDNGEENVKRIKNWTPGKILRVVLIVLAVIAISVYFILSGG